MLRWLTAGESHGPALVAVLEGLPAGVAGHHRRRRRRSWPAAGSGYGRGARMKFEQDEVELLGGVRHGRTHGRPGRDPDRQHRVAEVGDGDGRRPGRPPTMLAGQARNAPLTRPRPGHADLAGMQKYGFDDARPVLERASARETAARVALGTVAAGVPARRRSASRCVSHVVAHRRGRRAPTASLPGPATSTRVDADPVRCLDPDAERGDGRRDRRGARRRRHPRRRRRGARLRPAAGPRQPRALGPPARRPAGRRADGHPGDQGRRGRRRVRARPAAAARGRTTRSSRGRRRRAPAHRPRRRHRGRHDAPASRCGCGPR